MSIINESVRRFVSARASGDFGCGNRLLASLAPSEQAVLAARAERLELPEGACLLSAGAFIEHVTFPSTGFISLSQELPDGSHTAIGLVGREGMVGLTALLGGTTTFGTAIVQVPGYGYRIPAGVLRPMAESNRNLRDLIRRYALGSLNRLSLQAGCLSAHPLEHRTARLLLDVQDRVGNVFPLTQDALAALLSARRPTVNAILQEFKAAGLIRHTRGRIAITDREGLERAACPCYRVGRTALEGVLPRSFR